MHGSLRFPSQATVMNEGSRGCLRVEVASGHLGPGLHAWGVTRNVGPLGGLRSEPSPEPCPSHPSEYAGRGEFCTHHQPRLPSRVWGYESTESLIRGCEIVQQGNFCHFGLRVWKDQGLGLLVSDRWPLSNARCTYREGTGVTLRYHDGKTPLEGENSPPRPAIPSK